MVPTSSLWASCSMRLPRGGCHSAALPPFEIMDQLRRADPASLTSMHRPVPEELNRIVLKCLAKDTGRALSERSRGDAD